MKKPMTVKRGFASKYDFKKLKKKGDWISMPDLTESQSRSVRVLAKRKGLNVSVKKIENGGGYLVELQKNRK